MTEQKEIVEKSVRVVKSNLFCLYLINYYKRGISKPVQKKKLTFRRLYNFVLSNIFKRKYNSGPDRDETYRDM